MGARISVWLLPVASEAAPLQALIDGLAGRYSAPRFTPHLTLLSDVAVERERALRALVVARACLPLRLETRGLLHSDYRFQAVIIALAQTPELRDLRREVARLLGVTAAETFTPHISLLYPPTPLDAPVRADICAQLRVASTYTFERLCVAQPGNEAAGWEDVERWQEFS